LITTVIKGEDMKPRKLVAINRSGAGWQIHAALEEEVNCVEFTMNAKPQIVTETPSIPDTDSPMLAFEPWIQFPPEKWRLMIDELFPQMVEAWNEKYGDVARVKSELED
jgi:hypothetical protein